MQLCLNDYLAPSERLPELADDNRPKGVSRARWPTAREALLTAPSILEAPEEYAAAVAPEITWLQTDMHAAHAGLIGHAVSWQDKSGVVRAIIPGKDNAAALLPPEARETFGPRKQSRHRLLFVAEQARYLVEQNRADKPTLFVAVAAAKINRNNKAALLRALGVGLVEEAAPAVAQAELGSLPKPEAVALVACCGKKEALPMPAGDMYCSDLFKKCRAYAGLVSGSWFILSAKYGLVNPAHQIESYNLSLDDLTQSERLAWSEQVARDIQAAVPAGTPLVALAGGKYVAQLIPLLEKAGYSIAQPLKGKAIGQQKQWLKAQIESPLEDQAPMPSDPKASDCALVQYEKRQRKPKPKPAEAAPVAHTYPDSIPCEICWQMGDLESRALRSQSGRVYACRARGGQHWCWVKREQLCWQGWETGLPSDWRTDLGVNAWILPDGKRRLFDVRAAEDRTFQILSRQELPKLSDRALGLSCKYCKEAGVHSEMKRKPDSESSWRCSKDDNHRYSALNDGYWICVSPAGVPVVEGAEGAGPDLATQTSEASAPVCRFCGGEMQRLSADGWQCQADHFHRFWIVRGVQTLGVWNDDQRRQELPASKELPAWAKE